ncbi:MAG: thiamine pyrophosphate-binding protein [Pararhodobacter sp.]|nr:thiamine pyrophosphate-binding protein [Pararhodobacter sp.]
MTKHAPERPQASPAAAGWGSDAIAQMLRALQLPFIALNPGSSFRGLHDSLVNHLGNEAPQMLLCLHEEHAVALAHGWAKVTGRPLAVALHANVGLMHASMAIYNAWCDRVPMLIIGATGPVDAAERRPWIDWIHTSRDQAALVRPFVKWDDQPASLPATLQSLPRAHAIARTAPCAPVYVCLDVSVQEAPLAAMPAMPDPARYPVPAPAVSAAADIATLARWLREASAPALMLGRMSRAPGDWARRVALAEAFGARVLSDFKTGASFPTDHPLHAGPPGFFLSPQSAGVLQQADLIVALDWVDPAGTLQQAPDAVQARVVQVGLDHHLHNGWSLDHHAPLACDLNLACDPDLLISALLAHAGLQAAPEPDDTPLPPAAAPSAGAIDTPRLAAALRAGLAGETVTMMRLPLGWDGGSWDFRHPLDYLGYDGGAGIGSGPGMCVGAALALRDSARLPVAVLGDGDLMMGVSAMWTAARYAIPMLIVVANNRSYFNDEIHQEKVARIRGRPVENRWIGQRIAGPDIDIAAVARAQGAIGHGPVSDAAELAALLPQAVAETRAGNVVVIDARVEPGYSASMAKGMTEAATGGEKAS